MIEKQTNSEFKPNFKVEPILYVRKNQPDSSKAIKLVKKTDDKIRIIYVTSEANDIITPWFVTEDGGFYGLTNIEAYVNHWKELLHEAHATV